VYEGEAIDIGVVADGAGAPLAGVEIYVDGKRIASLTSPPWTVKWAMLPGTHDIDAIAYTATGKSARATPMQIRSPGRRPTPTPTRAPIMWISSPTLYKEITAGVNDVWTEVDPASQVNHVDIYIDGYPGGYATGPGFRVNGAWTPTPPPPPPTATLDATHAISATIAANAANIEATRVAKARSTATAQAWATERVVAATQIAIARNKEATAVIVAATTSPTPTSSPTSTPTPTFVVYTPLPDPMLGDFVARCLFQKGRHRVTAIGYDEEDHELARDETWVIVR
jgi:hypothetical protein